MFAKIFSAIVLLATLAVAGPSSAQYIGMPNPASELCVQTGGTLDIRDTGSGQVGVCSYGGVIAIEEWTLYDLLSGWSALTLF